MSDVQNAVVVGTKVSTILYNRGIGYVYAVHGTPKPETVQTIVRGVVQTGGSAKFDIVFECGSYAHKLPECILHGVQWKIYSREDGFADAAKIAELRGQADLAIAEKERIAAEEKAAYDAEVAAFRVDPAYADLEQGDEGSGKIAAKNIRILLKKAFPGIKFSVRKDGYGTLRVHTDEDVDHSKVEEIKKRFKSGYYDTHSDRHTDRFTPFMRVFGHAEYIF